MTPELDILMKVTMVLLLGLLASGLAARAQASVRHLMLASTLGCGHSPMWVTPSDSNSVMMSATWAGEPRSGFMSSAFGAPPGGQIRAVTLRSRVAGSRPCRSHASTIVSRIGA